MKGSVLTSEVICDCTLSPAVFSLQMIEPLFDYRVGHFGERIRPLHTFGKWIFKRPIIQRHGHLYKKHKTLQLLESLRETFKMAASTRVLRDGQINRIANNVEKKCLNTWTYPPWAREIL